MRSPWYRLRRIVRVWSGAIALIGLLGLAGYAVPRLWSPAHFPLRYVHLHGTWQYLDATEVQSVIAGHSGSSFFALDIEQIQQQLTALPWIKQATVQRRWPDGLDITLQERQVFARWMETELIDQTGQRFQPAQLPDTAWPVLSGADGQEQIVMQWYQKVSQALSQVDLRISALSQDARGAWTLQLANGLGLKLGKTQLNERLQRFIVLYPKTLRERLADIDSVDLRYPNSIAVRWSQLPAGADAALAEAKKSRPRLDAKNRAKAG